MRYAPSAFVLGTILDVCVVNMSTRSLLTFVLLGILPVITCAQVDTVETDALYIRDGVVLRDEAPFTGIAIHRLQGDWKTERDNGTWTIVDGKLHGPATTVNGTFMYRDGLLHGRQLVRNRSGELGTSHEQSWEHGVLMEDRVQVSDTLSIREGDRKYYRKEKRVAATGCGPERTYRVTVLRTTVPDAYYRIAQRNRRTGYSSSMEGAMVGGGQQGKWSYHDTDGLLYRVDFYLNGELYYRKSYDRGVLSGAQTIATATPLYGCPIHSYRPPVNTSGEE